MGKSNTRFRTHQSSKGKATKGASSSKAPKFWSLRPVVEQPVLLECLLEVPKPRPFYLPRTKVYKATSNLIHRLYRKGILSLQDGTTQCGVSGTDGPGLSNGGYVSLFIPGKPMTRVELRTQLKRKRTEIPNDADDVDDAVPPPSPTLRDIHVRLTRRIIIGLGAKLGLKECFGLNYGKLGQVDCKKGRDVLGLIGDSKRSP